MSRDHLNFPTNNQNRTEERQKCHAAVGTQQVDAQQVDAQQVDAQQVDAKPFG